MLREHTRKTHKLQSSGAERDNSSQEVNISHFISLSNDINGGMETITATCVSHCFETILILYCRDWARVLSQQGSPSRNNDLRMYMAAGGSMCL